MIINCIPSAGRGKNTKRCGSFVNLQGFQVHLNYSTTVPVNEGVCKFVSALGQFQHQAAAS